MRRTSLLAVLALVIGTAFVTGCAARPEVTPGAPPPTPAARVDSRIDEQAQDESPADLIAACFPLPAAASDTQVQLDDTQCVDCHTDKQAVQDLAAEPEEEEELSEGEG